MPDVIVVGAGPAGVVAAKRCAEYGLDTLLLEKRKLPREKVCSGMVMGPVAVTLTKQEFGEIPETVLSNPPALDGLYFHTPGIGSAKLDGFVYLAFRKNLDYWMTQQAEAKGCAVIQGAKVNAVVEKDKGFVVHMEKDQRKQAIEAKFVIGADGAGSIVRRSLYPALKVVCSHIYQEYHKGELDLDNRYFHWFYTLEFSPAIFTVHKKDNILVIDYGARPGMYKKLIGWAQDYLAKNHNIDFQNPLWRGACLQPALYRPLISRTFLPAKGNALLAGEAGGFVLPITGEGIGTCLRSGLAAADAVIKAIESGEPADNTYLKEVQGIIDAFDKLLPWFKKILDETRSGGKSLPQVVADAYRASQVTF